MINYFVLEIITSGDVVYSKISGNIFPFCAVYVDRTDIIGNACITDGWL